jgi:thioredoxin-dependent peroxiredoxin
MATTALDGTPAHTVGELPAVGSPAPAYTLTDRSLGDVTLADAAGQRLVLNIFPSVGTGVCAAAMRRFNELAARLDGTRVLCVSMDLPFALSSFCGAEGLDAVEVASAFRSDFGDTYGVRLLDGAFAGLLARSVVVVDEAGTVTYTQLVPDIAQEPDYDAVLAALG